MPQTVFVGLSGGVDSSVSAALLKEQGYEVVGVYMKNWTKSLPGFDCPWREDLADAKRVAVKLGIELKIFDFETEYKQKVVDYMIEEYKAGRTPNPDIMCNQEIKFKLFLETALEQGADLIATGHYARIGNGEKLIDNRETSIPAHQLPAPNPHLMQATDKTKDQSYFLYRVTAEALSKTLFPIGNFYKKDVRKMATERGLSTAVKKDSVGICFVGQVGIKEFLSNYVETKPGAIIDKNTHKQIGQHDGAIFYTIGQRHGLNVGGGLPYYVVGKDMAKNEVYVTTDLNDDGLWRQEFTLADVHWINGVPPIDKELDVRVRHLGALTKCRLAVSKIKPWKVVLREPFRALAPGQSAVIYDDQTCLGGGIIV